ncbi:MAG TPA: SDR family NAD(P)-dependent oxidoreductase [Candidatus Acidoferrum sp.]|nr:SDR family NAD(P)-dependent oxidoreductase [Candidatus Acidoferrum sp.]
MIIRRRLSTEVRGRTAAITGAASGVGRALALELAKRGANLALSDIDPNGLDRTATQARAFGGQVTTASIDVTDEQAVTDWAESTASTLGGVHMIFNVAGIIHAGNVIQTTTSDIRQIIDVDFWGVVHGTRAFLPHIIDAGGGNIVNVSSAFGLLSAPSYGAYNAAKFAVRGWTDALRHETRLAGHPVSVTCVYPGGIKTPIMANATSAAGTADAERRRHLFNTRIARTEPRDAAHAIVCGALAGRPRVLVGADARVADLLARITGSRYELLIDLAAHYQRRQILPTDTP